MAIYEVNERGVQALKMLAAEAKSNADNLGRAVNMLNQTAASYKNMLGPHQESVDNILEKSREATIRVWEVASKLNSIADKYQEIIDMAADTDFWRTDSEP